MQGVIIWYSKADFRAIIWCEDSKDLGVANGATAWRNPMVQVEVGDAVSFRLDAGPGERRCHDIELLETCAAPALHTSIQNTWPVMRTSRTNHPLHICVSHV